jgi:hypothetical protein
VQYFYGLIWLLFAHWVADFVLQSDKMALNKSKSNRALSLHVAVYTFAMMGAAIPLGIILGLPYWTPMLSVWLLINAAAHFVTDYITSRITSRLYENHRHYFYVMIGFDQLIHYFTLGLTMVWLLK